MRRALVPTAALAAMICVSTSARASDFEPWFATSRAGGYLDLWPADNRLAAMFGAELQFRVARSVFLDVSITGAFGGASAADSGVSGFAYGNPTIGAHYAGQATRNFSFYVGGLLTLPFLHDPDSDVAYGALISLPIRGYYDADRLLPGHFAVRAMAGFEWNFVEPLYLRAELRPVVYVPTRTVGGFDARNEADLLIEHAVEFEGRFRNGFGMGMRLQAVALPTVEGDQAQAVFEPFISVTPKRRGFFMKLGFPVALDEPLGFGLERDKLAAGRIILGGQW